MGDIKRKKLCTHKHSYVTVSVCKYIRSGGEAREPLPEIKDMKVARGFMVGLSLSPARIYLDFHKGKTEECVHSA